MALSFMPGQFSRRASFYHQLAQLTAAGIGLVPALEQLKAHPPSQAYRMPIQQLLQGLSSGMDFSDSLSRLGNWVPEFDRALLHAGEFSGRLDACLRLLAIYYDDRARLARQVLADVAYPVALFHFAVFIFPFAQFFLSGDVVRYLGQTFGILLPVYLVAFLLIWMGQGRHGETWRSLYEILVRPIPVLGAARRCLALARLAGALDALLNAGVTIIEAWDLAAAASGSPALCRTVARWRPSLEHGRTPAEMVNASAEFPEVFRSQYAAGEISGTLEDTLKRLQVYYQEEGSRKLHAFAQWMPRLLYLLIVGLIAYRILSFWMGYFNQVRDAGGF